MTSGIRIDLVHGVDHTEVVQICVLVDHHLADGSCRVRYDVSRMVMIK